MVSPCFIQGTSVAVDDWFMLLTIVTYLMVLLHIGPCRETIKKGVSSMYRFNSNDGELYYPVYAPIAYIALSVFSCIGLGISFTIGMSNVTGETGHVLLTTLTYSVLAGVFFTIKMLLYQVVNSNLYKSQKVFIKTVRWNGFYLMAFAVVSIMILSFSVLGLFMKLPSICMQIWMVIVIIGAEIGLIYKLKTALFKNKCTILGFIAYLCALQIVPIILMMLLLVNR